MLSMPLCQESRCPLQLWVHAKIIHNLGNRFPIVWGKIAPEHALYKTGIVLPPFPVAAKRRFGQESIPVGQRLDFLRCMLFHRVVVLTRCSTCSWATRCNSFPECKNIDSGIGTSRFANSSVRSFSSVMVPSWNFF